jgi:hypothetical protein
MEILEFLHPLMGPLLPVADLVDKLRLVATVDPVAAVVVVAQQVLEMFPQCHQHKEITVALVLVEMRRQTGLVVAVVAQEALAEIPQVRHRLVAPVITPQLEPLLVVQVEVERSTP